MKVRSVVLAAALLATVIAAYFAPPPDGHLAVPTSRPAEARRLPATDQQESRPTAVLKIRAREDATGNPLHAGFAAAAWADKPASALARPVAAPQPAPLTAPEPIAPPLPFKVLGRYLENGKSALFLQYNEQNLVVRAGDTLVGQYKVESLDEAALTLLHLPTNQKQTLAVGAAR